VNSDFFYDEGDSLARFLVEMTQFINYPETECPDTTLAYYHRFYTILTLKGCLFKMVNSILGGHTASDKIS
jgi:hypothetical protein